MSKVKYLVMDVDGTLTDGKIYMGNNGEVMKAFNIKDGYAIKDLAMAVGIVPVIITARKSDIVLNRCKELDIKHVYQNCREKLNKVLELTTDLSEVAYIGDDILDLKCMMPIKRAGGIVGCPSDAVKEVREACDFVSSLKGGEGAVRDFVEYLIELQ